MSIFQPNDKFVCIDDTPIPTKRQKGQTFADFSLPGGTIEKGKVYCVNHVRLRTDGRVAIGIVGKPAFDNGKVVLWNGVRFRKVQRRERKGS